MIGKTGNIRVGLTDHTVAVLLPEKQYDILVNSVLNKMTILFVLIVALSVAVSEMLSHRYIRPLLSMVEQVKTGQFANDAHISEFNDLFAYLAEQDRINEENLSRLQQEKADAMTAANELQSKFDETEKQNERLAYS